MSRHPWLPIIEPWLTKVRGTHGWAVGSAAPVPVEQAAHDLGVRVRTAALSPTLWGITWNDHEITISSHLSNCDRRFTIAHELAHIGQKRKFYPCADSDSEWLADWFARDLLLPREGLAKCDGAEDAMHDELRLRQIAQTWQVPDTTVLLQAALLTPVCQSSRVWIYHGRVLCSRCGDRTRLAGCLCASRSRAATTRRGLSPGHTRTAASALATGDNIDKRPTEGDGTVDRSHR
jgi:hypothetical protein